MHKIKLILLLILPISVFAQDLGIIDTRTTKNPALNGTYRISTDGKNLFFRNFIGISEKVANTDSATFTGLITLPSTTSIGSVSSTELSYLDGVTSSIQTQLGNKQPQLNGTGFVKASGTTISYDNSTYLTTSSASNTYLPLAGGTITGDLTLNKGAKFVGQVGLLYNGNQVYVDFFGTSYGRIQSYNAVGSFGMPLVLQGSGSNVGIGIVPTSRKLEVSDVIRSIGGGFEAITPLSSGSSYQWLLNSSDNKYYLNSSTDKFVSNFSTRLLVDNSGNVGIGTTSPNSVLHTIGTIQTSSTSSASSNYANRFNNIIFSRFDVPTTFTNAISNSWSGTSSDQTMNFEIGNGSSTRVTAMTLLGNGNVGIGVTAPSSQLEITKSAMVGFYSDAASLTVRNYQSGLNYVNDLILIGKPLGSQINVFQNKNLSLATNNIDRLTIFGNGNIGIGTTTDAGYKLDVNGTSRFSNTTIHSNSASFYNSAPIAFFDVTGIKNVLQRRQVTGEGDTNGVAHFGYNGTTYSLGLVEKDNGSVGIATHSPAASAVLDITSTTQGVLFPRLTTAQINAIVSPANGLTVYNTDLSTLCFYHVNTWKRVVHLAM
jgi:hypothetical protein